MPEITTIHRGSTGFGKRCLTRARQSGDTWQQEAVHSKEASRLQQRQRWSCMAVCEGGSALWLQQSQFWKFPWDAAAPVPELPVSPSMNL